MTDRLAQQQAAIDDFLDLLRLEQRGDTWVGRTPDWYGPVVFGGVGLAVTIRAACCDAPAGARLHSLHAHFLRPVQGGQEIAFTTEVVKAGRAFNLHRVTASQHAKPVITMTCSFTTDTDGYVRVDDWLLQDVHSLVNAGGRGTLRGVIRDRTGTIVASMAQEMLLQPFPP